MTKTVVGHFGSDTKARAAVAELERLGFAPNDVSYIARDGSGSGVSGTTKGAAAGGVTGVLAGLAALAIPGVGAVIAAGPLATALVGAGVGAATGGMLGALGDMGFSETDARLYVDALGSGGSLVLVQGEEVSAARAEDALRSAGAGTVRTHERIGASSGFDPADAHKDLPNFGDEGGSSQWGRTVLTAGGEDSDASSRLTGRDHAARQHPEQKKVD